MREFNRQSNHSKGGGVALRGCVEGDVAGRAPLWMGTKVVPASWCMRLVG